MANDTQVKLTAVSKTDNEANRSNESHEIAWRHFYPEGNGKAKAGYVLHHKDESLMDRDIVRYNEWLPEDLVMVTRAEHCKIHYSGEKSPLYGVEKSAETRQKLSESHKGQVAWNKGIPMTDEQRRKDSESHIGLMAGEKHPMYGKHHTDESRKKISESHRGKCLSEEQKRHISESMKRYKANRRNEYVR